MIARQGPRMTRPLTSYDLLIKNGNCAIFDKNGELLNGFPVYGTSAASMGAASPKNLVVKGDAKNVVYYSIN